MKRLVKIIALALPIVILTSTFALAQEPLEGEWAGGFRIARKWGFIKIQFIASEKGLRGIAEYPPENAIGLNLTQVGWQSPNLHFQLPREAGTFVFDGQLKEGAISGTVRLAGARAAFRLNRIANVDAKVYGQYPGEYQLKSGGFISIYPRRGGGVVAHKSGQWVWLYFLSETSLLSELGETIAFVKNEKGEVINLTVRQNGFPDKLANQVKLYTPEEVSFRNREVTLAGTLLIPNKHGPHPVIVMLHGSGPQNRSFGFIFKTKLPPKDQLWRVLNVSEKQAVLENVRCPLLALFGELDRIVMTEESVVRMEKTLKQSRHEDYTIRVYPKAGHNLVVAETGVLPIDLRRLRPAPVPGAYEMMIDWILKRVSVSR